MKKTITALIFFTLSLCLTTFCLAFSKADLQALENRASKGDVEAQIQLSVKYATGDGVEKNSTKSFNWAMKAAQQGDERAQAIVGIHYYTGIGAIQNDDKALDWFIKAANQGQRDAMHKAAEIYEDKNNFNEARKWYVMAATLGHDESALRVGTMYYEGQGVEKNLEKAFKWHMIAAQQGQPHAQTIVGLYYLAGLVVAQDDAKALEWLMKAAQQEQPIAMHSIAEIYAKKNNFTTALTWYTKAGNLGHMKSQLELSLMYHEGIGVKKDLRKSIGWAMKAAQQGNIEAQTIVGLAYLHGYGVTQNKDKALEWYKKAAQQGHPQSTTTVGDLLYEKENFPAAAQWYAKAADLGQEEARLKLAMLYHLGKGVRQDASKTYNLLTQSANNNYPPAIYAIGLYTENGEMVKKDIPRAKALYEKACNLSKQETLTPGTQDALFAKKACDAYARLNSPQTPPQPQPQRQPNPQPKNR